MCFFHTLVTINVLTYLVFFKYLKCFVVIMNYKFLSIYFCFIIIVFHYERTGISINQTRNIHTLTFSILNKCDDRIQDN